MSRAARGASVPARVEAVLFDGDDTLWDFTSAMRRALRLTLDELWSTRPESVASGLTVDRLVAIRDRVASELGGRVLDQEMVRLAAFERTLEEIGMPDPELAGELCASYLLRVARTRRLDGATRSVLDGLRDHRRGLVTNGTARLEEVGLDGLFDVVVRAADVGVAKPDPQIFHVALGRLGVRPEHAVHVGNSLADDVAGAAAAGLRTIWLVAGAEESSGMSASPRPDATIGSLSELPDVLRGWAQ